MDKQLHKNFYSIIPAFVRYDNDLTANAKLLYGEITALTNEKGFCWAENEYFSKLYNVSKKSISKWISSLIKKNYIKSEIVYKQGTKEILYRYLRIVGDAMEEKFNTPMEEKFNTPMEEKFKDNNKINNKKEIYIYKEKRDIPELSELNDNETNTELPFLFVNKKESNNNEKEKRKQKVFEPPKFEEVLTYAKSRGREELAETFYDYFNAGNWFDSQGKPVKSWKQKFITWETKNPKREKARIDNDTYKVL